MHDYSIDLSYSEQLTEQFIEEPSLEKMTQIVENLNKKIFDNGRITFEDYCYICGIKDTPRIRRESQGPVRLHKIVGFSVELFHDDHDYYSCYIHYIKKKEP